MGNRHSVLLVDEDNNICNYLNTILSMNNYDIIRAKDGSEAFMMITSYCPDIILLELSLPDMDGMRIIKSVREWSAIPIIVVSSRTHERDKIKALDLGADDYITKPFGNGELLARIRTALRHIRNSDGVNETAERGVFVCDDFVIDFDRRCLTVEGKAVHLTQNEYKIVALLAKYAGRVLTYEYIIKCIWGPKVESDNQILRVNMANIRHKIEKTPSTPKYIITEIGVGYRMIESPN
ncbi:MAG: DNA-binding response regulator [Clostridiales bacterium GWF2_38_85]|nr:MAG: DNA-binding response regulator [Clostridiales bacterium GWF2_38_85]HBL85293.1 DNA-binding response regulator [Clostridiales bacterium]